MTAGGSITETAFPTNIAGVATAVPAFIGYTAKAAALMQPVRIGSMADFESVFGGAWKAVYTIDDAVPGLSDFNVVDSSVTPPVRHDYRLGDPWPRFSLYDSMRLFYANGGGQCYVVSVGDYSATTMDPARWTQGLGAIAEQAGPTMLVIPELVLVEAASYGPIVQAMLAQCGTLGDRVAILDVHGGDGVTNPAQLQAAIAAFRDAVGPDHLSFGMAYFPFLRTTIVQPAEIDYRNLADLPKLQAILGMEANALYGADANRLAEVKSSIDAMTAAGAVAETNQKLVAALPLLASIEAMIRDRANVLPPSGAMAGVYTQVDATLGVWNAPANVELSNVATPTYQLTNEEQEDLSVPLDGKAVNALRELTGRGTVVWGARTLDGNSNDYRYIQVRRTLIYIEQSIQQALAPFAFAPNDGVTWTTVMASISSFLTGLWSQGGLLGTTAAEAFSVACGLGSTMTSQDILDGYLRVRVTLQLVHPAEFIELTFLQTMVGE
jgi:phage tail sheath protein FI